MAHERISNKYKTIILKKREIPLLGFLLIMLLAHLSCEGGDNSISKFQVAVISESEDFKRLFRDQIEDRDFQEIGPNDFSFYTPDEKLNLDGLDLIFVYYDGIGLEDPLARNSTALGELEIPVVAVHGWNDSFSDIDAFVGYDPVVIGEMQANYLSNIIPQGNYLLFFSKTDSSLIDIQIQAIEERLKALIDSGRISMPDVHRIDELNASHTDDSVMHISNTHISQSYLSQIREILSKSYLQSSTIPHAIIAENDSMAESIILVLEELQIEEFPLIAGWEGQKNAARLIVQGKQTMTMLADKLLEITALLELLPAYVAGITPDFKDFVTPSGQKLPAKLLSPFLIDRANLRQIMIESGHFSEEEIFH